MMFDQIRNQNHLAMSDDEIASSLVAACPNDEQGPLFWA